MMRSTIIWVSALCIGAVSAFQDTSLFFLFSTSSYAPHVFNLSIYMTIDQANSVLRRFQANAPQIVSAAPLSRHIVPQLESCPSDTYILVSQPGANAADYSSRDSVPQMRARMLRKEGKVGSTISVEDVLGDLNLEICSKMLQDKCGAGLTRVDASSEYKRQSYLRLVVGIISDLRYSWGFRHCR